MNIYINARFLTQSVTGVQRVSCEIVKAIDDLLDKAETDLNNYKVILLSPKNIIYTLPLKHIELKSVGMLKGHLWEQLELPLYARKGLLLSLSGTGPLLKYNQLVIVPDSSVAAAPTGFSWLYRAWYKMLIPCLGRIVKKVFTISEFSKSEIVKYFGLKSENISVVLLGCDHLDSLDQEPGILERHSLQRDRYILAVSSMNPNKNFSLILNAIDLINSLDIDIVIAGGTNDKVFAKKDICYRNNLKLVGYVDDIELKTLYANAACFIFPSLYEGFGLPPLEAMRNGCPVIVSNAASLPEVCGDAAVYCNPHDPADLARKIEDVIHNDDLRNVLRQKGVVRAGMYSWNDCARTLLQWITHNVRQI